MRNLTLLSVLLVAACSPSLTLPPPTTTDNDAAATSTDVVDVVITPDASTVDVVDVPLAVDVVDASDVQDAVDVQQTDVPVAVDVVVDVPVVAEDAVAIPTDTPPVDVPPVRTCPPEMLLVGDFCVDRLNVTVRQYFNCVFNSNSSGIRCSPPLMMPGRPVPNFCTFYRGNDTAMMNCVDWQQAVNYCIWTGRGTVRPQLPSEAQWEQYRPLLVGNLEWTRDLFDADAGNRRVVRDFANPTSRISEAETPTAFRELLGFRCVRNPS